MPRGRSEGAKSRLDPRPQHARGPSTRGSSTHSKGRAGETLAVGWLESHGYRILERNYRTPVGEIDLVAMEDGTLCFVEVKARATTRYGPAVTAIGSRQQQRVARAAALYLASDGWAGPCRFDVLGLDLRGETWHFELVKNAFDAA